jgi:hypothetical protein
VNLDLGDLALCGIGQPNPLGAGGVNSRATDSSCTGGSAFRSRPRFLASADQTRCCEAQPRHPVLTCSDALLAGLVGDGTVAEGRVIGVNVERCADQAATFQSAG